MPLTRVDQSKLKTSGPADGSPRYEKGEFPVYDQTYNELKKQSPVLNKNARSNSWAHSGVLTGIGNAKSALRQIEGNEDGYYKRGTTAYKASIPSAKERLKDVHRDFKLWQREQVKEGKALEPPKQWPDNHLKERLKAEAALDVHRAEKAKLINTIERLEAKRRKTRKKKILAEGPRGNQAGGGPGSHDPPITAIDGQNVSFTEAGQPFIDEPDSPYHEMTLYHYKQMAKRWTEEQEITRSHLRRRAKEYKENKSAKWRDQHPMFTWRQFEKTLKQTHRWPGPETYPDWPDEAQPVSEME